MRLAAAFTDAVILPGSKVANAFVSSETRRREISAEIRERRGTRKGTNEFRREESTFEIIKSPEFQNLAPKDASAWNDPFLLRYFFLLNKLDFCNLDFEC